LTEQRYGVGFLIIHHGTMRNWYLLDWWEKGDIIHQKLFSSPLDKPGSISVEPDKSLIACVLDQDILTVGPAHIMDIQVEQTWLGGKLVYENVPAGAILR
jgi:hypothetical protein